MLYFYKGARQSSSASYFILDLTLGRSQRFLNSTKKRQFSWFSSGQSFAESSRRNLQGNGYSGTVGLTERTGKGCATL